VTDEVDFLTSHARFKVATCNIEIGWITRLAVVDTGATRSLISLELCFLKEKGLTTTPVQEITQTTLVTANGSALKLHGEVEVDFVMGGVTDPKFLRSSKTESRVDSRHGFHLEIHVGDRPVVWQVTIENLQCGGKTERCGEIRLCESTRNR
jgi:hypothetical protein